MPDNPFDPVAFMCIMACCFPFIPWLQLSVLTEAYRRKRNNDPKKLPKRRRRLSVPSRCVSNVDCAFLSRLPIELRLEIYTLVPEKARSQKLPIRKRIRLPHMLSDNLEN